VIPHQKQAWFNLLFAAYARRRIRSEFHAVRILGFERALPALRSSPVLAVSNHACWWDPLLLIWLANYYIPASTPCDGYALMDAKNLRRFPFFRRMGVFGVDLEDPLDRAAVLAYTQGLLDRTGRLVWIFPQGAERPVTEALRFHRGAAVIAKGAGCPVVPVAIRPEFGRFDRPVLWLSFGWPLTPSDGGEADVRAQEEAVAALLNELEEAVRAAARRQDLGEIGLQGTGNVLGDLAERSLSALSGRRRRRP
jgi:1-acyl-sn-glycerol-3-phosphate acyltransferase